MAKEILLYWGISDWTVESLINQLEAYKKDKVTLRVNSPGGNVYSAYGLYAKILEHGDVHVKIDGIAASAAGLLPFYAKTSECLNTSTGMLHRATIDGSDKDLNPERKKILDKVNGELRAQVELKVNPAVFQRVTGNSIDEMFSMEGRLNIWLDAEQMKSLGIVSKVNPLTPEIEQKLASASTDWASQIAASIEGSPKPENTKPAVMKDLAELREKYPAIYAEAVAAGVAKELDRVNSVMVFAHLDADGAKKIIASGLPMTETQRSEFALKAMSPETLKKVTADTTKEVKTDEVKMTESTQKATELAAFEAQVKVSAGNGVKIIEKSGMAVVTAAQ